MKRLTNFLTHFNSNKKSYYPFFMASNYTPLEYSPYYVIHVVSRHKGHKN